MEYFQMKRGDTSPVLRFALKPTTLDISGATVRFQMRTKTRTLVIDELAEVVSDLPPVIQYAWQEADTATAGSFEAEFKVTYADGGIETFPNTTFIFIQILEDVR
jgi:hypothetical protein